MPYTAADVPDMNYPAIAVVKLKPPPRNAVWLQKPIVCSDKVGGTNNFYLNQIDPRPE
jgi:hypothetical protein